MDALELLAWGQAAKDQAAANADSITPDVPAMPGMGLTEPGYSSLLARERHGWKSIEARLGASLEAALDDDWRPLQYMHAELCDTV